MLLFFVTSNIASDKNNPNIHNTPELPKLSVEEINKSKKEFQERLEAYWKNKKFSSHTQSWSINLYKYVDSQIGNDLQIYTDIDNAFMTEVTIYLTDSDTGETSVYERFYQKEGLIGDQSYMVFFNSLKEGQTFGREFYGGIRDRETLEEVTISYSLSQLSNVQPLRDKILNQKLFLSRILPTGVCILLIFIYLNSLYDRHRIGVSKKYKNQI